MYVHYAVKERAELTLMKFCMVIQVDPKKVLGRSDC